MTVNELAKALAGMTDEELKKADGLFRQEFGRREQLKALSFLPGDKVSFDDRYGRRLEGVVEYVNQKSVSVKVGTAKWRVGPSLLSKVA